MVGRIKTSRNAVWLPQMIEFYLHRKSAESFREGNKDPLTFVNIEIVNGLEI